MTPEYRCPECHGPDVRILGESHTELYCGDCDELAPTFTAADATAWHGAAQDAEAYRLDALESVIELRSLLRQAGAPPEAMARVEAAEDALLALRGAVAP